MCWFFKRDFQLEGEKKQMMLSNYFLEIPVKKPACNTGTYALMTLQRQLAVVCRPPQSPPGGAGSMHGHSTDSTMHAALNTMTNLDAFCPKIMILFV